jgi:hypothetical protein
LKTQRVLDPFRFLVIAVSGWMNQRQLLVIDYLFPGSVKGLSSFLPGKFSRPSGQEQHVCLGEMMLAVAPGHLLDHHAAVPALDLAHAVEEENQQSPERNEFEASFGEVIIARRRLMAA